MTHRQELERLYASAVAAADPRSHTARAVAELALEAAPVVVAVGKAAASMAAGAVQSLAARQRSPLAGVIVSHQVQTAAGSLPHMRAAHPVPDESSLAAAQAIADLVPVARAAGDVVVLLSGGASSLMAHPVSGITPDELRQTFDVLLRSGTSINVMNAIRRRILRFGGGRLALALAPARVHCLIVSDVMGNELASIGSGPCVPDPSTAADVRAAMEDPALRDLPVAVRVLVARALRGELPETPKPDHPAFAHVHTRVILDNSAALNAVHFAAQAAHLRAAGTPGLPLAGDAATAGRALARTLAGLAGSLGTGAPLVWAAGGETTVSLPADCTGIGGRCQELALACALELDALGARNATVLAAGTDGRDGPTDAAGAVVSATTIAEIARQGRDPARDLIEHNAYPSLAAAGALLHTGATGTNVNDVVIAMVG